MLNVVVVVVVVVVVKTDRGTARESVAHTPRNFDNESRPVIDTQKISHVRYAINNSEKNYRTFGLGFSDIPVFTISIACTIQTVG